MKKSKLFDLKPKKNNQKVKIVKSKQKTIKTDVKEPKVKKVSAPKPPKPKKIKPEKQEIKKIMQGRNAVFKEIEYDITREIRSCRVGIYQLSNIELSVKTVLGAELESLTAEKYFSLGEPTVYVNPAGISDDTQYLNRFIMRFTSNFLEYLLVVSSYAFESLTQISEIEKIQKIIKERAE